MKIQRSRLPGIVLGVLCCGLANAAAITPTGYSYLTSPSSSYPDSSGNELLDGNISAIGWGNSSMTYTTAAPYVGWQWSNASIQFNFAAGVNIANLTIFADDAEGAAGVYFPSLATISMGATTLTGLPIANPAGSAPGSYTFSGLGLTGTSLTLTLNASPNWLMLSEVQFDGGPASANDVPLPATLGLIALGLGMVRLHRRRQG